MKIGGLDEMIQDMKSGVFDFTDNGNCTGCGQCCANILPISAEEIKRIRRYIKKHGIKEHKHNYPTAVPAYDFTCPFRNDAEKKCDIYEIRPEICRDFKCDKPSKGEPISRELKTGARMIVDMRKTFFGGENR